MFFTVNVFCAEITSIFIGAEEIVVLSPVAFFTISEIPSWLCSVLFAIFKISSDVKNASHLALMAKKKTKHPMINNIFFICVYTAD